jgi:surface carbohydrate biosynthesis protein
MGKKPLRVALVVDHPDRDLAGLVLVALELARRGVACHLVPMNLQAREIWALAPDLVLFNYLRASNEVFGRQLAEAGIAFGVLDTEGAIWSTPEEYASLLWKDAALRRQARCVCMWGASLAAFVVGQGLYSDEQVVVTGCPRFDLYAAPWRRLREDVDEALRRPARRILINTNFSVSNPRFTTADKCVAMHHTVLGYSQAELRHVVDAEAAAIRAVGSMAARLGDRFPELEIVIRPHPFEDPAPYESAAARRRNVRVNQIESIQAAIFGACAVIQRSCTTAVEAGLAGVPAFSPQWIAAPFLMPLAEAASVPCASFEDLTMHIGAIVDGTYRTPPETSRAIDDVMRECCVAADGQAHRRVSDAVFRALERLALAPAPASESEALSVSSLAAVSQAAATAAPSRIDYRRCRQRLYGLDALADASLGASPDPLSGAVRTARPEGALARAARHARLRLGLSPEWSFTRMREVPAQDWMNGRKHFDAALVQRLVDRACELEREPHVASAAQRDLLPPLAAGERDGAGRARFAEAGRGHASASPAKGQQASATRIAVRAAGGSGAALARYGVAIAAAGP